MCSTISVPVSWPTARSSSRISHPAFLWLQTAGRADLERRAPVIPATGNNGRLPCCVLLHRGLFRDGFYGRPQVNKDLPAFFKA